MYINSSNYYRFNQKALINKYLNEVQKDGVCNGLCIEFTRHELNKKNQENFIVKLKNKLDNKSKNFLKRIFDYQKDLQTFAVSSAQKTKIKYIKEIDSFFLKSNVIGISFMHPGLKDGHIIALSRVRDEKGNITGFKLFDPNFGLYEFDNNSPLFKENLNSAINKLKEYYKTNYAFSHTYCSNLEALVEEVDINKKGKDKYLEGKNYNLNYDDNYKTSIAEKFSKSVKSVATIGLAILSSMALIQCNIFGLYGIASVLIITIGIEKLFLDKYVDKFMDKMCNVIGLDYTSRFDNAQNISTQKLHKSNDSNYAIRDNISVAVTGFKGLSQPQKYFDRIVKAESSAVARG